MFKTEWSMETALPVGGMGIGSAMLVEPRGIGSLARIVGAVLQPASFI